MTGTRANFYERIYFNICNKNVNNKINWHDKTNELHRHHVNPRHNGGLDVESNFTYVSVREHIICHFLLWKINRNVNDLRSMYMLGARLSRAQRKIIGDWCYEHKIGMSNPDYDDIRKTWSSNGAKTQIGLKIGIHNPENFKKNASLGGKASIRSTNNPWSYWASPEGMSVRARLGGKSHIGKLWIHKDGIITRCKLNELSEMLNSGWFYGMKDGGREYVNDGIRTFRISTNHIPPLLLSGKWFTGRSSNFKPDRQRPKKDLSYESLLEYMCQGGHNPPR